MMLVAVVVGSIMCSSYKFVDGYDGSGGCLCVLLFGMFDYKLWM